MGKGADVASKYAVSGADKSAAGGDAKERGEQDEDGAMGTEEHVCEKCGSSHDGEPRHGKKLLVCGACGKGWHNSCLKPALAPDDVPLGTWYCSGCRRIYSPDYSTFEEEDDIGDAHGGVPIVEPPSLGASANDTEYGDDDQCASEESDEDAAEPVAKPEKRAFGAVDELQQREYEQWAHRKAKRLNKQRKWDEAIEVAKDGLDIDPNSKFLDDDLTHAFLSKGNEELAAANYGKAAIVFRAGIAFSVETATGPVGLRDTEKKDSKLKAALAQANRGERNLRIPVYQDKPCAGCFCGCVGATVLLAVIGVAVPPPESICASIRPCLNGAECTDNLIDGTHTCTCAPGWSGEDCSILGNGAPATLSSTPEPEPAEVQSVSFTVAETQALVGVLLICGGAAAVWGGVWLRVVRKYPRKLVVITFGATVCAQCTLGALLLAGFGSPNGEPNGFGIMFFLSAGMVLLFGFVLSRQNLVPFAVALFCSATDVMHQHSSMLGVVYATAVITIGWLFICCLALTVTGVTSYGSLFIYFTYFWFAHTSRAVVHCSVAGTTANWYFVTHQIDPVLQATRRAVKTSLGSLAFGSLLVAVLQLARLVRVIVESRKPLNMSQMQGRSGMIGQVLETFNDYAYVQIAVYGRPYMHAAKTTAHLLRNTGVVAIVGNTIVVSGVCVLGCVLAGALAAALAWWLVLSNNLEDRLGSDGVQAFSFLCFCLGYLMALPHMEVLRAVATTVVVCFAQNPHVLQANNPRLYNEIEGVFSDVAPYENESDDQDEDGDDSASGNESYDEDSEEHDRARRKMVRFQP